MTSSTGNYKNIRAGAKCSIMLSLMIFVFCNYAIAQETGNTNSPADISAVEIVAPIDRNNASGNRVEKLPAVSAEAIKKPEAAKFSEPLAESIPAPTPQPVKVGSGSHLASVALGLVFIVILILALGWLMRRFNQGGLFNNSAIKIVAAMPLGTRERLLVVDISGQQLLLGVTATQINTLHVFAAPVIDPDVPAGSSEFGRKLLSVLQQGAAKKDTAQKDITKATNQSSPLDGQSSI